MRILLLIFHCCVAFTAGNKKDYFVVTRSFNNTRYILLEGHLNGLQLPLKSSLQLENNNAILKTNLDVSGSLDFISSQLAAEELEKSYVVKKPETSLFRRWFQLPLPNESIVNICNFISVNDEYTLQRTFLYSQPLYSLLKTPKFIELLMAESPVIAVNEEMDVRLPRVPNSPQQLFSTFVGMLPVRLYQSEHYVLLEKNDDGPFGVFSLEAPVDRIDSLSKFIGLAAKSVYPFAFPYVGDEPYFMDRMIRYTVLSREAQEVLADGTRLWTGQFVLVERIDQAGLFPLTQSEQHLWVNLKDLLAFSTDNSKSIRGFKTTKNKKSGKYKETLVVYNKEDGATIEIQQALVDMLTLPLNQEILGTRFFSVVEESGKEFEKSKIPELIIISILSFLFGVIIPIVLFYQRKN